MFVLKCKTHRTKIAILSLLVFLWAFIFPLISQQIGSSSNFSLVMCLPNGEIQEIQISTESDSAETEPSPLLTDREHCPFCRNDDVQFALLQNQEHGKNFEIPLLPLLPFEEVSVAIEFSWPPFQARAPPILVVTL